VLISKVALSFGRARSPVAGLTELPCSEDISFKTEGSLYFNKEKEKRATGWSSFCGCEFRDIVDIFRD